MNKQSSTHTFIIKRMHQLLNEQGWCQFVMAEDRNGTPCALEDGTAYYFSLVGAFFWVQDKYPNAVKYREEALAAILKQINVRNSKEGKVKSPSDIIKDRAAKSDEWKYHFNKFNDASGRTKMEILRLLTEAADE